MYYIDTEWTYSEISELIHNLSADDYGHFKRMSQSRHSLLDTDVIDIASLLHKSTVVTARDTKGKIIGLWFSYDLPEHELTYVAFIKGKNYVRKYLFPVMMSLSERLLNTCKYIPYAEVRKGNTESIRWLKLLGFEPMDVEHEFLYPMIRKD